MVPTLALRKQALRRKQARRRLMNELEDEDDHVLDDDARAMEASKRWAALVLAKACEHCKLEQDDEGPTNHKEAKEALCSSSCQDSSSGELEEADIEALRQHARSILSSQIARSSFDAEEKSSIGDCASTMAPSTPGASDIVACLTDEGASHASAVPDTETLRRQARDTLDRASRNGTLARLLFEKGCSAEPHQNQGRSAEEMIEIEPLRRQAKATLEQASRDGRLAHCLAMGSKQADAAGATQPSPASQAQRWASSATSDRLRARLQARQSQKCAAGPTKKVEDNRDLDDLLRDLGEQPAKMQRKSKKKTKAGGAVADDCIKQKPKQTLAVQGWPETATPPTEEAAKTAMSSSPSSHEKNEQEAERAQPQTASSPPSSVVVQIHRNPLILAALDDSSSSQQGVPTAGRLRQHGEAASASGLVGWQHVVARKSRRSGKVAALSSTDEQSDSCSNSCSSCPEERREASSAAAAFTQAPKAEASSSAALVMQEWAQELSNLECMEELGLLRHQQPLETKVALGPLLRKAAAPLPEPLQQAALIAGASDDSMQAVRDDAILQDLLQARQESKSRISLWSAFGLPTSPASSAGPCLDSALWRSPGAIAPVLRLPVVPACRSTAKITQAVNAALMSRSASKEGFQCESSTSASSSGGTATTADSAAWGDCDATQNSRSRVATEELYFGSFLDEAAAVPASSRPIPIWPSTPESTPPASPRCAHEPKVFEVLVPVPMDRLAEVQRLLESPPSRGAAATTRNALGK